MSDIVVQSKEKLTRAQKAKEKAKAIAIQLQELQAVETKQTSLSNAEVLGLVKSGLLKDAESMTDEEKSALSLQDGFVVDFVNQAKVINAQEISRSNKVIEDINQSMFDSAQWLTDFVKSRDEHYENLAHETNSLSADEKIKQLTGMTLDEFLGEEMGLAT